MPDEFAATLAALDALRHSATVADRNDRLRMWFAGDKAADALNGLVTNDVAALSPGTGLYAAALTPKGKIIADLRILRMADGFLVDVPPAAAPGWFAMIRKFVNPRLAKYEDRTATLGDVGLFGPAAATMLRDRGGLAVPGDLPAHAHVSVEQAGGVLTIVRAPDYDVDGYDVIGPRDPVDRLRAALIAGGAIPATTEALECARVEAGRPLWGVDMDETTLAQEVDMDRLGAISYNKGCYTGQETVARVHFRGHVNRLLRGVRFGPVEQPSSGSDLTDADGKVVGVLRSVARSPRLGVIGLALLRREIEPGATVRADARDGVVIQLPFPG